MFDLSFVANMLLVVVLACLLVVILFLVFVRHVTKPYEGESQAARFLEEGEQEPTRESLVMRAIRVLIRPIWRPR